jgi:NAD(P)-dependent dehydrogenase (short-subunit alcohol dehydrogenase family)
MDMDNQPLALITGAAHRLGRIFALHLARQGYAILLHYKESERDAKNTAAEIESFGFPARLVRSDLTKTGGIKQVIRALDSQLSTTNSKLRVLVNSASIMNRSDLRSSSTEDWDTTFALNLRAPFFLTRQVAERMMDGGVIVNITDVGAQKLWTGYPAYTISKSALEMMTRLFAKSLAPGIRVNAIAPGLVFPSKDISPEKWNKLIQQLPLQREASPEEIASALDFLIKNESITGQTIVVDGGYSLI